jgi:hypothetical protein
MQLTQKHNGTQGILGCGSSGWFGEFEGVRRSSLSRTLDEGPSNWRTDGIGDGGVASRDQVPRRTRGELEANGGNVLEWFEWSGRDAEGLRSRSARRVIRVVEFGVNGTSSGGNSLMDRRGSGIDWCGCEDRRQGTIASANGSVTCRRRSERILTLCSCSFPRLSRSVCFSPCF